MFKVVPKDAVLVPPHAKRVFEGVIYDVYQWPQKMFDGSSATFEMLKRPDTVSVICVVEDKVLVLEEEQPHSGARWSFPGGRVDETDQSLEHAAKRELLEETGYEFERWRLLHVRQPHTKIEWFIHIFLAWGAHKVSKPKIDAGEKINMMPLGVEKIRQMSLKGVRYLNEGRDVLEKTKNVEELLALPEFQGQEVDR
jgi:ADP-ribose pyrophosphatase